MNDTRKMKFSIYRYDPDKDAKPYMQDYEVTLQHTDKMLLDAIQRIKWDLDDSLSIRRSCREGVCGSDAMNINGKNGLACITNLLTLKEPVVLKPLPGLPVIRDLIVDMTQFFNQYHSIKPYLVNNTRRQKKSACKARPNAKSSTVFTSAFCARAAAPVARVSGGTPTNSSVPPVSCRPIDSSPTAATKPPASASTISKTPTACSAATPS